MTKAFPIPMAAPGTGLKTKKIAWVGRGGTKELLLVQNEEESSLTTLRAKLSL